MAQGYTGERAVGKPKHRLDRSWRYCQSDETINRLLLALRDVERIALPQFAAAFTAPACGRGERVI
jgi:hypothetical protein